MADIQKLEAKYTKLDCILHRNEEDLNKLSVNIEKYEQQTTTLSKETIPPLKAWFYIGCFPEEEIPFCVDFISKKSTDDIINSRNVTSSALYCIQEALGSLYAVNTTKLSRLL